MIADPRQPGRAGRIGGDAIAPQSHSARSAMPCHAAGRSGKLELQHTHVRTHASTLARSRTSVVRRVVCASSVERRATHSELMAHGEATDASQSLRAATSLRQFTNGVCNGQTCVCVYECACVRACDRACSEHFPLRISRISTVSNCNDRVPLSELKCHAVVFFVCACFNHL